MGSTDNGLCYYRLIFYSFKLIARENILPPRGIRQEDPLSFCLFLLCAEGFKSLLDLSDRRGDIKGVVVVKGGTRINHLLFVDDCVILCMASLT